MSIEENKKIEDETTDNSVAYKLYTQKTEQRIHHVYLSESITSSDNYTDLLHHLRTASSDDQFRLYLNNFGGYLHTGVQLINAMRDSPAVVITVVDAPVYSMASLLALCGDDIIINNNSYLMFHDYSGGTYGKGNELFIKALNDRQYTAQLFSDYAYPFLSEEEINDIFEGKDLYISAEEARKRMKKVKRMRNNAEIQIS
jgi:ATP-dependent protease ClpP protease subunit